MSKNSTPEPQSIQPQLVMRLDDLTTLPELDLPEGYLVRSYKRGDDIAWQKIIAASFKDDATDMFEKLMRRDPAFLPTRIWFVCRKTETGDVPVATAAA